MEIKNKKAQEEMVGFVLIVVIITIAIVILLIFSLRQPSGVEASANVENFLQAASYFSTDCSISGQILSLKKLIVACQNNELCSGKNACEVLNETLKNLIDFGWPGSSYQIDVYSVGEENLVSSILQLKYGNLTGSFEGGDVLFPVPPNNFHISMKVYSS